MFSLVFSCHSTIHFSWNKVSFIYIGPCVLLVWILLLTHHLLVAAPRGTSAVMFRHIPHSSAILLPSTSPISINPRTSLIHDFLGLPIFLVHSIFTSI